MTITFALSKGRLLEEAIPFLKRAGIVLADDPATTRQLIVPSSRPDLRFIIVRASDVPTYVQHGAADLGIAGYDVLLEHDQITGTNGNLYRPLELPIGRCRMMVAAPCDFDYQKAVGRGRRLRVATKYPGITQEHFMHKGVHVDLIHLYGSMELAPLVGLAEVIVDLVSTGNTLKANRLQPVEEITPIAARLIANPASLRTRSQEMYTLLDSIRSATKETPHPSL